MEATLLLEGVEFLLELEVVLAEEELNFWINELTSPLGILGEGEDEGGVVFVE